MLYNIIIIALFRSLYRNNLKVRLDTKKARSWLFVKLYPQLSWVQLNIDFVLGRIDEVPYIYMIWCQNSKMKSRWTDIIKDFVKFIIVEIINLQVIAFCIYNVKVPRGAHVRIFPYFDSLTPNSLVEWFHGKFSKINNSVSRIPCHFIGMSCH